MKLRHLLFSTAAFIAALGVTAALASAAGVPTVHVYQKCASKGNCPVAVYLNKKQSRVIALSIYQSCPDGSSISISMSHSAKVSSKGKFKFNSSGWNYDKTAQANVEGTATVSGKVKKGKKVSLTYSIDQYPAACKDVASGKATAKYRGAAHGG